MSSVVPPEIISCKSILKCGDFCGSCNKKHFPFKCRKSQLINNIVKEDTNTGKKVKFGNETVDECIFDDLCGAPESVVGNCCKIFELESSGMYESDVRRKLFNLAEKAFVRKKSNNIVKIKYIENKSLKERFNTCKQHFMNVGISTDERLVFHGTNNIAADSIFGCDSIPSTDPVLPSDCP